MTNDREHPCLKRLDADCFRARPAWAKQAFAYRLVHLLTPKALTKRLPKGLRTALLAPGIVMPPGVELPPGVVVGPGGEIPAGWTPGDPVPPGAIAPGTVPPGAEESGATPPTYTEVWGPGPPSPVAGRTLAPGEEEKTITCSESDGRITTYEDSWAEAWGNPTTVGVNTTLTRSSSAIWGALQIGKYQVKRVYLYFNLLDIPIGSTIVSATVGVVGYNSSTNQATIQKGTQSDTLQASDFNEYAGDAFKIITWQKYVSPNLNTNLFELNAAGRAYVGEQCGLTAKFCLRDYPKDYLNVEPTGTAQSSGMYFANYSVVAFKPYITVIYKQ